MARVLLVDDDDQLRIAAARALRARGHTVEVVGNGAVALERLAVDPLPDVIILDLNMPIMDGFSFREAQTRDARLAWLPVVVASGGAPGGRSGCLEGTVMISKPVTGQALAEAIATAMSRAPVCRARANDCDGCLLAPQCDERRNDGSRPG